MSTAIVVGNPKPRSRTYEAARLLVEQLTGQQPDVAIDLIDFGAALLDWSDAGVGAAISTVKHSALVVFASPTYKASYTGLLKLFLDRIGGGSLSGVTAIPLMLGGDLRHSLAPEVFLKPVLAELGATTPTRGLFVIEAEYNSPSAFETWLQSERPQLAAVLGVITHSANAADQQ
jgi:FMN reductase